MKPLIFLFAVMGLGLFTDATQAQVPWYRPGMGLFPMEEAVITPGGIPRWKASNAGWRP